MALKAQLRFSEQLHNHRICAKGSPTAAVRSSRPHSTPLAAQPRSRVPVAPFTLACGCSAHKSRRPGRTAQHAYNSGSWSSTPSGGSSPTFSASGPYRIAELDPITVQLGYNNGSPVSMQLEVYYPAGARKSPLAIISAGFLLNGSLYRSYAEELARWGYVTVLYDLSELSDDLTTVNHLRSIIDFCATDPRLLPLTDTDTVYLAGHSRGGKLSCLTAARDERVKALCLLDPVDVTPMTPPGPGYPSCLAGLRNITSPRGRCVPVLVVGAGSNGDVIPASGNYKRFTSNCVGPCWEVDLLGAGHLQFLDRQVPLLTAFSAPGPTPDATVRQISCSAMVAWAEKVVRPQQRRQPIAVQDLQQFLQQEGSVLERLAPVNITINNLQTLQFAAWQQQARRDTNTTNTRTTGAGNNTNSDNRNYSSSSSSYSDGSNQGRTSSGSNANGDRATSSSDAGARSASAGGYSGSGGYGYGSGKPESGTTSWSNSGGSGGYGSGRPESGSTSWSNSGGSTSWSNSAPNSGYSRNEPSSSGSGSSDAGKRGMYGSDPFSSNSGASYNTQAGGYAGAAANCEPVVETYEELMKRRARELKEMLVQRGIDCSDCYEKSELARRLVERAGVGSSASSGRY